MARLAVAASAAFPDLRPDWPLLRTALAARGIAAETVVWTDDTVDWDAYDLILAIGAWDNIHQPERFLAWVDDVASRVPLHNTPATLRWNLDKHYLAHLVEAGVPVIPTTWVEPDGSTDIELPDGEFVLKPTVSGGGFQTARYDGAHPDDHARARDHLAALARDGRPAMLQPYEAGVDSDAAETGLIYLAGTYSHAIRKAAQLPPGTVAGPSLHNEATITPGQATEAQRAVAEQALAAAEALIGPLTYARVDLIPGADGHPMLMELELLDPALFFDHHPPGAETFADILSDLLADTV